MPSTLLARLRQETRQEHEAIEQALAFTDHSLTRKRYCQRIEQFYGFYAPIENLIRSRWASLALPNPTHLALSVRLGKTPWLQQDLHHLQIQTADLPMCRELPPLETEAALAGCLYVLEGATLGGRIINQNIHAKLGVTPAAGGRFFHGYGEDTGKLWQAMRHWLVSRSACLQTEDKIVTSATATFVSLRRWCENQPSKSI